MNIVSFGGLGGSIEDVVIDYNTGEAIYDSGNSPTTPPGRIYRNVTLNNNGSDILHYDLFEILFDRTLDAQAMINGKPLVGGTIWVRANSTLTITPGTDLRFGIGISIEGNLIAEGTPAQPISFSSRNATPAPGDWGSFSLYDPAGSVRLAYCNIGYAGISSTTGAINLFGPNVLIRNCHIHHSATNGIYLQQSKLSFPLNNLALTDNRGVGISLYADSQLQAYHTTLARNQAGIEILDSGSLAILTNTILSANGTGVQVWNGSLRLTQTLWDNNSINSHVGPGASFSESGHFVGQSAFAPDGYHLSASSLAVQKGLYTQVTDDIDGESRPQPSGSAPDLGADESPYTITLTSVYLPVLRK